MNFKQQHLILLVIFCFVTIDARSLSFSEKELKQVTIAFKEAVDRHHLPKVIKFAGTFECTSDEAEDCELAIEIDINNTDNGQFSGNDLLNGIGNGNGNDNGNNGNNNGNVILQIFNIPIEEIPTTRTESTTSTTVTWWT